jgi:hypothetical protein
MASMKAKSSTLDTQIRTRVEALLNELTHTIRRATLEAVQDALGTTMTASAPIASSATAGRPAKSNKRRGRAGTRSPEQVAKTGELFADYVKHNQGQRLEQISKGLGIPTRELTYPVGKLLEAKRLSTKGQARGRKYFAK